MAKRLAVLLATGLLLTGCADDPPAPSTPAPPTPVPAPGDVTVFIVPVDGREVWCVQRGVGSSSVMSCGYKQQAPPADTDGGA